MDPEFKKLGLLHAMATFMKSHFSTVAYHDLMEFRQLLGGLGYHALSNIGHNLGDLDVNMTWEGDNKVLLQQSAKYVLKQCSKIFKGKPLDD